MNAPRPARPAALLLAGPTAVGKSAVAVELARRAGGEILSADSMQVYRGLDIGTAKPTHERSVVPHHLIDLVEPRDGFDAARWLSAALSVASEVRARGKVPIVCGGTGLYFRAWMEGLEGVPGSDPELRRELESLPLAVLLDELERGDAAAYQRIDRKNPRRVVRAVEILRLRAAGGIERATPGESVRADGSRAEDPVFVLRRDPADLRRRMEARVDAMFAAGLVDETRRLLAEGLGSNRTALQAIGYRQVVEFLGGTRDISATLALIKSRTWQFGRRQMTWFRHRARVVWMDVDARESAAETAGRILAECGKRSSGEGERPIIERG